MPKIKNVSPFGDLDVPLLGRVVASGETVEVTDEQAELLLQQPDNYRAVGAAAKGIEKEVTNDDDAA